METVVIVIHLMIVLALVGVVLLQRSEGGGLGIGGGSGFMTARGAANALTRATAILAAAFFATSLGLSLIARYSERTIDILDRVPTTQGEGGSGVLDQLGGSDIPAPTPAAPSGDATPAPTTPPATGTAPAGDPATAPAGEAATPPAGEATTPPAGQSATPPAADGATATPPSTESAPAAPAQPAAPQVPVQ
jgi:preprotein translocase subunit SecG